MPGKRRKGLKRDKLDKVFSDYIRTRDKWTCQRCGKYYPEDRRQGLHCAHNFSRRHTNTRWHKCNAVALCYGCHQYIDSHAEEKILFFRRTLGNELYDMMRDASQKTVKFGDFEKRIIHDKLKDSLAAIMEGV